MMPHLALSVMGARIRLRISSKSFQVTSETHMGRTNDEGAAFGVAVSSLGKGDGNVQAFAGILQAFCQPSFL
jgi:hypothetical protein